MPRSLLLVHSPLVGPSSFSRLATSAEGRGHAVVLPDLTQLGYTDRPQWAAYAATAAAAGMELEPPIVVVGHSGAGVFLPDIGRRLGERLGSLVFVDAVVPARHGVHRTSVAMQQLLDRQVTNGMLKPWLEWWPDEAVAEILPNPADRLTLIADMPSVSRSFYDEEVPVENGWSEWPCAYLKLSPAYDGDFDKASERRWTVSSIDSTHLGIYTEPDAVLDAIESVIDQMGRSTTN